MKVEVENIPKKLQGRGNDYGVSYEEHGSKLSQGLVDILDLYKRIETSDSLSEEDMIAFTVILQEKEDFKDQKDFIEEEGMKINGVKDKTHAVVTAPRNVFNNLQKRVKTYQEKGRKKAFQYIAGFEPYKGIDKQTASLLRYIEENPEVLSVDVQMMILPDIEPEKQERIKEKILKRITECHGAVQGEPYYLSDGTPIIRAVLSPSGVDSLAGDQGIYRIEQTGFFQLTAPSAVSPYKVKFSQTRDFCAVIEYYITTKELETVADEFHAEGIRFSCENCPLHEVQTDGRKKRVACKYHELGITHMKHEACELFYKKLKQGEVEPVGL